MADLPDVVYALLTVTGDHGSASVGGQDVRFGEQAFATAEDAAAGAHAFYQGERRKCRWRDEKEDEDEKGGDTSELSDDGEDSDVRVEYEDDNRENPEPGFLLQQFRFCFLHQRCPPISLLHTPTTYLSVVRSFFCHCLRYAPQCMLLELSLAAIKADSNELAKVRN